MKVLFLLNLLGLLTLLSSQTSVAAPNASFVGSYFSGSSNCTQCHNGLSDTQGQNISIVEHWSSSMMANSSRDPYWRAKVASELHRNPNLSDEINDKCSRCHTPMANEAAKKDQATLEILGTGFLHPNNQYYNQALDGVSCTVCHQIADNGLLGTLEGFSGNYQIADYSNSVDRPAFGQYTDPVRFPMQNSVRFTPQHGSHTSRSELCATCHNVKTPFVDAQGQQISSTAETEFPEQMVFTEWKNSAYQVGGSQEKTCQACHMPTVSGEVKIASRPPNLATRPNFARHQFLGANTTMLDILNSNRDELDVSATTFESTIIATREMLQSSANLEILSTEKIDNSVKVVLRVNNTIGHKLPTSYPSRRAFIHFKVTDNNGTIVFESGKLNADGSIVGNATDIDSNTYEPHYETITAEDQVQIYESIMQDSDGQVTHTLLRAATYSKDNRILPLGFDKATVPNDVAVKGVALTDDNFNLGSDTISYLFPVSDNTPLNIEVALNYQTLSYGHLQDMFKDADVIPEVARFKRYFEAANIRVETLTSINDVYDFTAIPTVNSKPKEGNSGTFTHHFLISIATALTADVTVDYVTRSGSASADSDFVSTSGTATISAGQRYTLIPVKIIGDTLIEADEDFSLVLSNPIGANFPAGFSEISVQHSIENDD
jgi:hypothetical protein